jgi:hypothetical protein
MEIRNMHIEKNKLPKGMSYPLKSSFLENFLQNANLEIDVSLHIRPSKIFFDASFSPPKGNFNYNRLSMRVGAVKSQCGKEAKDHMENVIIPDLIKWLSEILSLDERSPKRQ